MSQVLIVNLFAGSDAGKSIVAANVFTDLKWHDINCELILREERFEIYNQIYLLGKQLQRIEQVVDKADVIITDNPLLLSIAYKPFELSTAFDNLIMEIFRRYRNINYFIERQKEFNPNEDKNNDQIIKAILIEHKLHYNNIPGNRTGVNQIVEDIVRKLTKCCK